MEKLLASRYVPKLAWLKKANEIRLANLNRSRLWRYGLAMSLVAAAVFIKLQYSPGSMAGPYTFFTAATFLAAWFTGFGPALAATALCLLAQLYFFTPTFLTLTDKQMGAGSIASLFSFIGLALLMDALFYVQTRAKEQVTELDDERRLAESALSESEVRFQSLADTAPVFIWLAGPDQLCTYFNKTWLDFTGRTLEQETGDGWKETVHPDDLSQVEQVFNQAFVDRKPYQLEYRLRRADGQYRWFIDHGVPRYDQTGRFLGLVGSCIDITDRRTAERTNQELYDSQRRQSQRVNNIIANVPGVVWEAWGEPDAAGQRINYVSHHVEQMLGYTEAEWLSQPNFWLTIVHPDDRKRAADEAAAIFASGHSGTSQFRWLTKDGRAIWVESQSSVVKDGGHPVGMRGVTTDITDHKVMEQKAAFLSRASQILAASLDYETTLDQASRLMVPGLADWCSVELLDDSGNLTNASVAHADPAKVDWARRLRQQHSPNLATQTGLAYVLRTGRSVLYPEVPDAMLAEVATDKAELELLRQIGFSSVIIVPLKAGPKILGAMSLVAAESRRQFNQYDLTLAEDLASSMAVAIENARLYHSANNLAAIVASSDVAIIGKTLDGTITSWNQAAEHLYGYTASEAIGRPIAILIPADQRAELAEVMAKVKAGQPIKHYQTDRITKDRRRLTVSLSVAPIKDPAGRTVGISAMSRDITVQKMAEERLKYQARLLATVSDAVISTDLDYLILSWNRGAEELYGWTAAEAIGRNARDLLPTEYPQDPREVVTSQMRTLEGWTGELKQRHKNGTPLSILASVSVVIDQAGHQTGFVTVNRDISERARLEQQKDDFLAVASHELKTPVTAMKIFAQGLHRQAIRRQARPEEIADIKSVERQVDKMIRLVNNILDLTKLETGQVELVKEATDLTALTREVIDGLAELAPQRQFKLSSAGPMTVEVDPSRIEQVLINLLSNALQHSDESTPVEVKLKRRSDRVIISVHDQGEGISADQQKQLFQRFFQVSDNRTAGAGLGLYITKQIIGYHGGEIWVDSQPGRGSTFSFSLPLSQIKAVKSSRPKSGKVA